MPTLNFMKNGAIRQVPLASRAALASPSGVPCFCVQYNGTTWYAYTSALSTNAAAAFRYKEKTYYLVTEHTDSEVEWDTIYSNTSGTAGEYVLPEEYAGCPIKIECGGASGSSSSNGGSCSAFHGENTSVAYGGAAASGGKGGTATTYVGECSAGTVFTISLAKGNAGSSGSAGSASTSSGSMDSSGPLSGTSGGAGGTGFSVSVTNAAGETKTCTAYGGGGGGGAGGAGQAKIHAVYAFIGMTYTFSAGNAGKGGAGGSSGTVSGSSGVAAGGGDATSIFNPGGQTLSFNEDRYYGTGGAGAKGDYVGDSGSSGTNSTAYCYIKARLLA